MAISLHFDAKVFKGPAIRDHFVRAAAFAPACKHWSNDALSPPGDDGGVQDGISGKIG